MFKFFRQYNKIILVIGGCVLMIAFLIPQAVTMFGPERMQQNEAIGEAHGREITRGQMAQAAFDLELLSALPMGVGLVVNDPLAWMLLQRDAESMGLYASDREVQLALQSVGIEQQQIDQFARQRRVTPEAIQDAVRHLLISEQYRQLVAGISYRDPKGASPSLAIEKLQVLTDVAQAQLQGLPQQYQELFAPQAYQSAAIVASGAHRLSLPMLRHYVQNNDTTAGGRFVLIPPDPASVDEPSEESLTQLFEKYKDNLPAQGEPYAFGYRFPDRVKLSYLQIPVQQVQEAVKVDYVQVLDAYRQQQAQFADESGQAPATPTADAAKTITQRLQREQAQELLGRITAGVQSLIAESLRGQPQNGGYYDLPDDYQPLPWQTIIDNIQDEFGVTLQAMGQDEAWTGISDLITLPGIGRSSIGQGQAVPFSQYVANARGLVEKPETVAQSLRIQKRVASKPLQGSDGNVYFFRLSATEPAHSPQSLDEVRSQVIEDARTKAAFEQLQADADTWQQRAAEDGLDAVAAEAGVSVQQTGPFEKEAGTGGNAPNIPGIGSSRPFVDGAFGLVQNLEDPAAEIQDLPIEQRLSVTALPRTAQGPALSVFVLDEFQPLTRSEYIRAIESQARYGANIALVGDLTQNPLAIENLARRTGFDLEAYESR